ncbi:MAG: hypothetical protein NTY38_27590 [Acidobacteria bacterium]|nr:hypothetical protein [Acidobacteriota bacterium]
MELDFKLPPAGSLLLVAGKGGEPVATQRDPSAGTPVPASAPVVVKRTSPNALTLDYCDLQLGGKLEKELYYYVAADKIFKHYGFEASPWNAAVQYKTSILDRNNFPAGSGFEATFYFDVSDPAVRSTLKAVIERPEIWKVAVNGKPVTNRPKEWWLDRAFGVYDIGAHVVEGRNSIRLTASPMSVHHELEPIYLTGDFNVQPRASGWSLTAPSALKTGGWKEQGLPFYSYAVSYSGNYRLADIPGDVKVRLGKWSGTVAEVIVNGKSAGIIGWQPYEIGIARLLHKGENRIEVVVYGSLKNLLGPHHPPITRGLTSPVSFRNAPAAIPPGASYDLDSYGLMEEFQVVRSAR